MATDPLFNVMDLNGSLYRHVRVLQKIRLMRVALFYLKDFIFSCKYSDRWVAETFVTPRSVVRFLTPHSFRLQELIKAEPQHVYTDPDCYSMTDFDRVKNGKWLEALTVIVKSCKNHVNQCQVRI
jgi:run domain Beclin-1 interacting cysteine-rich containing protein